MFVGVEEGMHALLHDEKEIKTSFSSILAGNAYRMASPGNTQEAQLNLNCR